ncbi:RNA-guided endonuclease InsQ/TnpB family protein [Neobacillus drentensis]|uniref:RNA-guided endonuclease InsQ/TnpB family protein n=1 Tax=Neobacillus drentensis TaxID=220684 RepID=UPI0009ED135F|nr:RNA-guided endonuclease TnpB family protein [Neobacillus drentensis]
MEIATEKEVNKNYITQQIWIKKGHRMYGYFQNMTQNAKNMFNTTNFYIRQVYTGLTSNKALQPLQIEVLDTITNNIDKMNDSQLLAYHKRVEKQKSKPKDKQKEIKCHLFEVPFKESPYVDYNFLDSLFKKIAQNDYRSLPTQSSQGIMQTVFQNWKSFYASLKDYKQNPTKYKAKPKIPKYSRAKEKEVLFTNQDCVIKNNKFLKFPKTKQQLNIGKLGLSNGKLKQVRVIPKYNQYVVELVMDVPSEPIEKEDNGRYMSIDLGNDNLATIVTNTGRKPTLIKGKSVKSINQYYNKMKAYFLGIIRHGKQTNEGPFTTKRLEHLHQNRFLKIKDVFHKASNIVVKLALEENIHTIIIGQNKGWKQEVNIGKRNNQTFVHIPHRLFIEMVKYKAEQQGIQVYVSEESYTSKASFLDGDEIPTYGENNEKKIFSGRRIKRGLYRSKHGLLINADVNGAANIMKKAVCRLKKDSFFNIETINLWNPQSIII